MMKEEERTEEKGEGRRRKEGMEGKEERIERKKETEIWIKKNDMTNKKKQEIIKRQINYKE